MYVQVRTIDGKQTVFLTVFKLTTVIQFKELVEKEMSVKYEKQRLFFRGKQVCFCYLNFLMLSKFAVFAEKTCNHYIYLFIFNSKFLA